MSVKLRLSVTQHASCRAKQRGYRDGDIELINEFGEPVPEGVLLTRKRAEDAMGELAQERKSVKRLSGATLRLGPQGSAPYPTDWSSEAEIVPRWGRRNDDGTWHLGPKETAIAIRILSQRIERLERLAGTFVPVANGRPLSVYRPGRRKMRRILRGRRERGIK